MEAFLTIARALSHRDRVRILKVLQITSLGEAQLGEILGLAGVDVRDHASVLTETSLVAIVEEGRGEVYRVNPDRHNLYGAVILALLDGWLNEDPDIKTDRANVERILEERK